MGRYDDFSAVTADALDWALESLGLAAAAPTIARRSCGAYRTLGVFPEVRGALERLGARRTLAILSNGHPDMLDAVVDHNELRVFFGERVFSVHEAGVFKPDPRVYAIASAQLELPAEAIGFVSSNGWDAAGAQVLRLPRLLGEPRQGARGAPRLAARRGADLDGPRRAGGEHADAGLRRPRRTFPRASCAPTARARSRGAAPASTRSVALIGRVTNTAGSPRESSSARRRFSSIIGPSTKPSSSGAASQSSLPKR